MHFGIITFNIYIIYLFFILVKNVYPLLRALFKMLNIPIWAKHRIGEEQVSSSVWVFESNVKYKSWPSLSLFLPSLYCYFCLFLIFFFFFERPRLSSNNAQSYLSFPFLSLPLSHTHTQHTHNHKHSKRIFAKWTFHEFR